MDELSELELLQHIVNTDIACIGTLHQTTIFLLKELGYTYKTERKQKFMEPIEIIFMDEETITAEELEEGDLYDESKNNGIS